MIEHADIGSHSDGSVLPIDRAMRPVRMIFRWLSLALLAVMVSLPFLQIILREFLARPIVGAEELARFMLICLVFVSLPHVVYAGANIRLEELIGMLPRRGLVAMRAVIAIATAAVFAVAATATLAAIAGNLNTTTPTMRIPYWIFLSSAFAGFALAAIETVLLLIKTLAGQPLYVLYPSEEPTEDSFAL
ncbi:TRAP transporter small permease [Marinivivus vitaminiproducens]|uniref:TRAP transporter small permease n=1 Tax=Marinivivus vitaminiproducens TaxID=3035935 RepID=UPI0027A4C90C|nr:TRAP transporter small permease subunit [Geminicoccaceae bacterium SCSIO 64248]